MNVETFLLLLSGICWSIVYVDSIRIGLKDKSYAIPYWALVLNFSWELLQSVFGFKVLGLQTQIIVNVCWVILDTGILYTYFKYGFKEFPGSFSKKWFYSWSILGLFVSFVLQYYFIQQFGLVPGGCYSAFLQNLIMSILFIGMLYNRKSSKGQTMLISIMKWIGTLAPTVLFGIIGIDKIGGPNQLVLVLGGLIFLFDIIYIFLLKNMKQLEKKADS
jgi:hypothetical protein